MARDKRQMVLFSGGGYHYRGYRGWVMDEWLLALTGKAYPTVCLLTTPQGDSDREVTAAFKQLQGRCELTWAPMFNALPDTEDATQNLLAADLIYLPGGYAQGTVAAWRAAGWDSVLREAWERGVIIAGMCAGAMSFCHQFANRWMDRPGVGDGLGFQPVSLTAHAQKKLYEPIGSLFRHGIRDGLLVSGYQLQDGFALRFRGTELVECVTTEPADATGWYIEPTEDDSDQRIAARELYAEALEQRLGLDVPDEEFDAAVRAMSKRERRARMRKALNPRRNPMDGPVEVTASIDTPLDDDASLFEEPAELDAVTEDVQVGEPSSWAGTERPEDAVS